MAKSGNADRGEGRFESFLSDAFMSGRKIPFRHGRERLPSLIAAACMLVPALRPGKSATVCPGVEETRPTGSGSSGQLPIRCEKPKTGSVLQLNVRLLGISPMIWRRLLVPETMSRCAEHVLDRFHITMRLTVLRQYARDLVSHHHDREEAEDIDRKLRRIGGNLWNGNHRAAVPRIDDLVTDLDWFETDCQSIKAFRKSLDEFRTYVVNNTRTIPDYAERHHDGERVSTAFAESTVSTIVGKRFSECQQMSWPKSGHISCFRPETTCSTAR